MKTERPAPKPLLMLAHGSSEPLAFGPHVFCSLEALLTLFFNFFNLKWPERPCLKGQSLQLLTGESFVSSRMFLLSLLTVVTRSRHTTFLNNEEC